MANHSNSATADREIVISRLIDAPADMVFSVWTQKEHVDHWWGPEGFRNETSVLDLREGGTWEYVMHGADGKDYDNLVTYTKIKRPSRLEYWHGEPGNPQQFYVTVEFNNREGKTEVKMTTLFPTQEARDFVIREVNAIEGGNQTIGKLAAYLSTLK